ncbi:glycoside hydrolase domain-containing protein [Paenibacillus sp. GCM10027626]|uniref:glycoside hydrolase domain-containing protein n=1 Tax=Paenibacillus sp. GCM10027626 TaxID=3273411 RepID=UPI0036274501
MMQNQQAEIQFETRTISSLYKVFCDEELHAQPLERATALAGERYSFQVAYRSPHNHKMDITAHAACDIAAATVREVGYAPSNVPNYGDHDDNVLRTTPGLYPDPLFPLDEGSSLAAYPKQWRAVWVTVSLPADAAAGVYPIRVALLDGEGKQVGAAALELTVLPAVLPEQQLIMTDWFHTDCLATYYNVEVFSERHWQIIEAFVKTAVANGMNMILTPIFTPPLDTKIGGERPTVQLIDVEVTDGAYRFGFSKLERWIEMCSAAGIRYFELAHLFTQWGAKHAPKIVGTVDGEMKKLFGWETEATGEQYKAFLAALLPKLTRFLEDKGLKGRCYFHISDEPHQTQIEDYKKASDWVASFIEGWPTLDALTDYELFEQGLVQKPIPASNHIEPFLENKVEGLWTYYCCGQYREVSNRFFSMPSQRNRIIGLQLYKFQIEGFLHWGYNFWYTQYSIKAIDPYRVTDAGGGFPSGDSFLVYPGEDGTPVESLRLVVFTEALQDMRALQLLESLAGRERTLEILEEGLAEPLTFSKYPTDEAWLLACRERINAAIAAHSK